MTVSISQLRQLALSLEGISTPQTGNNSRAGWWRRIALAAEALAGMPSAGNTSLRGWTRRAAVALEAWSGTASTGSSLKRSIRAIEAKKGVTPGSITLDQRFSLGALAISGGFIPGPTPAPAPGPAPTPGPTPTPTPVPSLSLSSAVTQPEGNTGSTAFVWTLTLNRDGSTAAYLYSWAVTGSGTNPADAADFGGTLPSGSGTFAAGETSKTITVLAMGDTAVESNDTFTLTVTAAGLNTVTSTGTISNDDTAPTGYTFTNSEAQTFYARETTMAPNDTYKAALDGLVGKLKVGPIHGSNLMTAFDVFYIRALGSQAGALLNLMGTSFTSTVSTNPPKFHAGYGFTSNGIDSYVEWGGWAPNAGVQYKRDDASFGFWARNPSASASTNPQAGAITGSPWATTRNSSNGANYRINDATTSSAATSGVTDGSGLVVVVRSDANTKRMYRGPAQLGADATVASTALGSAAIREGNAFAAFAQDQLPFSFAGRALTANEVADLHAALSAYLTAINWQPLISVPTTEPLGRAAATSTLPAFLTSTRVALPDSAPTIIPGLGFTITGLARDPRDGTFWASSYGYNDPAATTGAAQPYIVHLSADRTTALGMIDLVAAGFASSSATTARKLQGLAFDSSDNTLWLAHQSGFIAHIAADHAATAMIGSPFAAAAINGIAYDSLRDKLAFLTPTSVNYINKDGTNTGLPSLKATVPTGDQITYSADLDAFLVSGGANGADGLLSRVSWGQQNYGALRFDRVDILTGSTAIEGIVRNAGVLTVANDWGFHGGGNGINSTVQYPAPY